MNLINYFDYRQYQGMIQAGREYGRAMGSDSETWKEYAKDGYTRNGDNALADYLFLAENYSKYHAKGLGVHHLILFVSSKMDGNSVI